MIKTIEHISTETKLAEKRESRGSGQLHGSWGEKKRNNRAPPCDRRGAERREIEEIHQAHLRDSSPDENRHEHSQSEVVCTLKADDLGYNQIWIPHHRPIEHDSSSSKIRKSQTLNPASLSSIRTSKPKFPIYHRTVWIEIRRAEPRSFDLQEPHRLIRNFESSGSNSQSGMRNRREKRQKFCGKITCSGIEKRRRKWGNFWEISSGSPNWRPPSYRERIFSPYKLIVQV